MSTGRPLLLGLDIGTTRIKAGAIDADGKELACAVQPTPWRRSPTGAEARPAELAASIDLALSALLDLAGEGPICAIGVTSMAETALLVGADGAAVGSAVAWYDERAAGDLAEMEQALTRELIGQVTGLTAKPIPTIATIRFLLRIEPRLRRAAHVLSVAEWVAHRLTGTAASEPSLASRTGALAVRSGHWWQEGLEWAGLPRSLFGELRPAGSSWGVVRHPPAGLARLRGATVTVAGHDHLVAAVGGGITGAGQVMDSCGTAEAVMRAVPADPERDPGAGLERGVATGWHALPGFHCLIAGLPLGIELTPLLAELGVTHSSGQAGLDAAALAVLQTGPPAGPSDPGARWLDAVQVAVSRATQARLALELLHAEPVDEIRVIGGWATNPVLRRLKDATFAGRTLYPLVTEAGVRGAGLMAGVAAGVIESVQRLPPPAAAGSPAGDAGPGAAPARHVSQVHA